MKKIQYLTLFNYYKQQEIKKGGFYNHLGEVRPLETRYKPLGAVP